ncbi:MAG: SUMF1/EgtB/PvdO family nonheme iron enzyme [Balneolales bacterium]|nr:SUMF1/EgtB/PvdO family nonheme iron enzyme [Balneolales bacterium]
MVTGLLLFSLALPARANNIQVTNVTVTGQNTAEGYWLVQFDLSWGNSWRTDNIFPGDGHDVGNWDAAWVFVKYRVGEGEWQHAKLHSSGHSTGTGTPATLRIGVPNERTAFHSTDNPGVGAFIYRSQDGSGTFSTTGNQLRWNYGVDGVPNFTELDIRVFAIEMVYVAPGAFQLGSGGNETGRFHAGGSTDTTPFLVTENWGGCIANTNGCLWAIGTMDTGGSLHEHYPTGVEGFYSMKYSVSQQQYVDFLNTLTSTQANMRAYTAGTNRNGISVNNGVYATTNPYVANNFMTWMDGAAYLDWSGLRPMTELEYEKAARGPAAPVANEYAWGTAQIAGSAYTLSNAGGGDESIATNYSTTAGNAMYTITASTIGGPVRVGVFATVSSNRVQTGAGYWGIMELSGNLWERPVTVANTTGRNFTGLHGNGMLTSNGHAAVAGWPGLSGGAITISTGSGLRGGSYGNNLPQIQVSDRAAAASIGPRDRAQGFRGVRSLPAAVEGN